MNLVTHQSPEEKLMQTIFKAKGHTNATSNANDRSKLRELRAIDLRCGDRLNEKRARSRAAPAAMTEQERAFEQLRTATLLISFANDTPILLVALPFDKNF